MDDWKREYDRLTAEMCLPAAESWSARPVVQDSPTGSWSWIRDV